MEQCADEPVGAYFLMWAPLYIASVTFGPYEYCFGDRGRAVHLLTFWLLFTGFWLFQALSRALAGWWYWHDTWLKDNAGCIMLLAHSFTTALLFSATHMYYTLLREVFCDVARTADERRLVEAHAKKDIHIV